MNLLALAPMVLTVPADNVTNPDDQQALISGALPIAGLFVALLLIAVFFLWRSLRKQIGKIDSALPAGRDDQEQALDRQLQADAVKRGEEAEGTGSSGT